MGDGSNYKQPLELMSISKGLRNAMFHVVALPRSNKYLETFEEFYNFGDNSYFGESYINLKDWKTKYW